MKKQILILGLMATSFITANAQLRIHQNGKLSFNTTETPNCPISLNHSGNPDYFMSYQGNKRLLYSACSNDSLGSYFVLSPSSYNQTSTVLSVYSYPYTPQNPNSIGIGLRSWVRSAPYAYGVLGIIEPGTAGAGIVGSYNQNVPSYTMIDHSYAGFFYGDVKVTSNLTVDGSIQGTVVGLSAPSKNTSNVQPLARIDGLHVSNLLSQLQTYSFQYDRNSQQAQTETSFESINIDDSTTLILASADDSNYIEKQKARKSHYALDATQLEEVFPGLVYEMADGTKAINYVEMVPLLVQTINELNVRVRELENKDGAKVRGVSATNNLQSTLANKARLYQNTPNPFTAQTEIRFSLPDDATNAYICIFDMTGKLQKKLPISSSLDSVTINGYELGEGIYLYSLMVNGQEVDTKRMILTK